MHMHLHFSPKIRLLGAAPNPLARAACVALPNAPQVGRLRALAGAEYERLDRLGKSMLTASGRTRSCPVRGVEKGRRWRPFSGIWVSSTQQTLCRSVELGFPSRMKTAPA